MDGPMPLESSRLGIRKEIGYKGTHYLPARIGRQKARKEASAALPDASDARVQEA